MGNFDQIKYITEYNKEKYDEIRIRIPKGAKSEWKEIVAKYGKSLNSFIVEAVEDKIQNLKEES